MSKNSTLIAGLTLSFLVFALAELLCSVHVSNWLGKEVSGNLETHGQYFDTSGVKETFRSMGVVLMILILIHQLTHPFKFAKMYKKFL